MSADAAARVSPLGRLLSRLAPIEPRETAAVVAAFSLFFFVFCGYFAVRPVRETLGTILGEERVADLYFWTWMGALTLIPTYGYLVGRVRRSVLLPSLYGFVALALACVGVLLYSNGESIGVAQFFYVFISVLNLFIVSVFWSFLLELFDSAQSKRLFGVIAAGGTAGALVGPLVTDVMVGYLGNSGVLFLGATMFAVAILCQRVLLAIWLRERAAGTAAAESRAQVREDRPIGGNPFAGVTLVMRSPYLLGIAAFVVLLASVSTFLYFEQLRLVRESFPDIEQRTRIFARLDWIVQSLTIVSQIFITGRIASRLGLTVLLAIVPVAMVFGFLALAASGTFAMLAVVFVLRRAGEYAFVRPGREMLFSRLDTETKYKAKNFIDVPVYRGADWLSGQVKTGLDAAGFAPAIVAILG
ncbi:MAG TPA: Npt1/Npt2 family nucleotide transporter, partial [Steroidobacteraceae bacterium]|nr:Npt1/Npt2 family nucleotide transporter [Steroidobacteraceae bacterium]